MRTFRPSREEDLPQIMAIVAQAQAYLAAQGIDQWQDGYPDEAIMREDIRLGRGYILEEDGRVLGIATVDFGSEPTYDVIYDGAWTTREPYACIHRVALDADTRGTGAADEMMQRAEEIVRGRGVWGIRIDTHHENVVMQGMLKRNGYVPCGTIYLVGGKEHGAPRVALEKPL